MKPTFLIFFLAACVPISADKAPSLDDTAGPGDSRVPDSESPTDDTSKPDSGDTATPDLVVSINLFTTHDLLFGGAYLEQQSEEVGESRWLVCDPYAGTRAVGTCYVVGPDVQDVQEDALASYSGTYANLGVEASYVGDGEVCSNDYDLSDANGRAVCWVPVEGEFTPVDDAAGLTVSQEGDEGAFYGTGASRVRDGALWFSQTGDGDDPDSVAIYEYDATGPVLIASAVCGPYINSYGAMDLIPFKAGVIAACGGYGGSYVTRSGVQWTWDTRTGEAVLPDELTMPDVAAVDDFIALSRWDDNTVVVGSLVGTYSGYLTARATGTLRGWSYARVETALHGWVTLVYVFAYADDGVSIGQLVVAPDEGDAFYQDIPLEAPFRAVWRLEAGLNGDVLALGLYDNIGAVIHIE